MYFFAVLIYIGITNMIHTLLRLLLIQQNVIA